MLTEQGKAIEQELKQKAPLAYRHVVKFLQCLSRGIDARKKHGYFKIVKTKNGVTCSKPPRVSHWDNEAERHMRLADKHCKGIEWRQIMRRK